jgi:branched-chain amino acid transport system ATP-binding protein
LAAADAHLPRSTSPMLQLDAVNVFYGAIHALHNLSITVNAGEVVTLIGANGAGKSTTLRAITGLAAPKSGRVIFEGEDITHVPASRRVARGISMAPEGRGIFANLTVLENLKMGAYLRKDAAAIAGDLDRGFALFPRLKERMKQSAGTLSGGEQQMLAIARALMSHPKLLLLDEPSLGLAPLVCHTIFSTIDQIKSAGTTLLVVEQNASAALKHADRAYVLETGVVILDGAASAMARDPRVREAYLGE